MPTYIQCDLCGQSSKRLFRNGHEFYCADCTAMNEPVPYDRIHYIEDEDLFSEDARDEDTSQVEYEREEDE